MITKIIPLTQPITYDLSRFGKPEEILFFDIETTGLSPERSMIYLIGCIYYEEEVWYLKQYFADSRHNEKEILLHFFTFLSRYKTVIHFNGTAFDLPFIEKRATRLNILRNRKPFESVDIYRLIKPFSRLFGIENCRQKTLERFLGIEREDVFTGGELIQVYEDYLSTGSEQAMHFLLLHNADDLKGMPNLLPLLDYPRFFSGEFQAAEISDGICTEDHVSSCVRQLFLTVRHPSIHLAKPVSASSSGYYLEAQDNRLTIGIPVVETTLKYFYPDYKDYYYLPEEDTAIHKSVAEYVDKGHRKKATAKTCYTTKTGTFIPQPSLFHHPAFFESYKSKPAYLLLEPELWENSEFVSSYVSLVIKEIL